MSKKNKSKAKTEKTAKPASEKTAPATAKLPKGGANVVNLPTDSVSSRKGFNPRTDLGEMRELKSSLREHGLICPITVCPTKPGADTYYVIAGHRRHAAWAELGKANIPAVVRDIAIDSPEAFQIAMSENSDEARTPLSADDQTAAFTRLLDTFGGEGHEAEVAKVAGYSAAADGVGSHAFLEGRFTLAAAADLQIVRRGRVTRCRRPASLRTSRAPARTRTGSRPPCEPAA
jgi:ParB/RepB/Spo0J family partition protein